MRTANFDPVHPLYRTISELAALTNGTRRCATAPSRTGTPSDAAGHLRVLPHRPGQAARVRGRAEQQRAAEDRDHPDLRRQATVPAGLRRRREVDQDRYRRAPLAVTVPPLSTVVYESAGRIPSSKAAPSITLAAPTPAAESRSRMQVSATVGGSSFYEVTFYAKVGNGAWHVDRHRRHRAVPGVPRRQRAAAGTPVQYRAVVLDNARHTATSQEVAATVPAPTLTIEAPAEGSSVRGTVEVRAIADPEKASHVVTIERQDRRRRRGRRSAPTTPPRPTPSSTRWPR